METFREAVGRFEAPAQLEAAIDELMTSGWDRADLSVLGQESLFSTEAPRDAADPERTADSPEAPRGAVISESDLRQGRTLAASMAGVIAAFLASGAAVVTGGGALAAIVGAAAAGGGATAAVHAVGRLAGAGRDSFLAAQAEHGGILLWVRLHDATQDLPAQDILRRNGAKQVHVHEFPARPAAQTPPGLRRA